MSELDRTLEPARSPERYVAGTVSTSLSVNDRIVSVTHDCRMTLLDLLRDELALSGAKKGCDYGQCAGPAQFSLMAHGFLVV